MQGKTMLLEDLNDQISSLPETPNQTPLTSHFILYTEVEADELTPSASILIPYDSPDSLKLPKPASLTTWLFDLALEPVF